VLAEIANEHGGVVFSDGYLGRVARRAEKLGLSQPKTTPEALKVLEHPES